ncbi:MAG: NmrA family NAD(P)-binding protein [Sandaracinus sp.]
MFAILGASGHTGAVVAQSLLAAGHEVRLLVRDPQKVAALTAKGAKVVKGDVSDAQALTEAFRGAKGAYVLLPPDVAATDLRAQNKKRSEAIREAAIATKLPHVVLLSSVGAQLPDGTGPIKTVHDAENILGNIPGTVLTAIRAAYFLENLAGLLHPMKTQGVLPAFSTHLDYPFPMIATKDIGETAARALLEPPTKNDVIELVGPKDASYADAARAFGAALGREVKAISVPFDAVVPTLTGMGMGAHMAGLYREMSEGFDAGRISYDGKGRRVVGKVSLEQFVKSVVG